MDMAVKYSAEGLRYKMDKVQQLLVCGTRPVSGVTQCILLPGAVSVGECMSGD